jgi:hypothetical protein
MLNAEVKTVVKSSQIRAFAAGDCRGVSQFARPSDHRAKHPVPHILLFLRRLTADSRIFPRKRDRGQICKTRKIRKIDFGPFFSRNWLPTNIFQPRRAADILRILRKNYGWVSGGRSKNAEL